MSVESDITRWQQRQNQNNNFTANIPYDLEQMRSETKEFMDDLMSRDQRMMLALVTLTHLADKGRRPQCCGCQRKYNSYAYRLLRTGRPQRTQLAGGKMCLRTGTH